MTKKQQKNEEVNRGKETRIPEETHKRLYRYLGDETADFLEKVQGRLKQYTRLWQLSNLSFMLTDTANLLFSCESENYGSCVLKMCIPGPEVQTEVNCLLAYDGRGYCKLWAYDLSDDVLLLERIFPGNQMWAVEDYRERARLMGTVMTQLKLDERLTLCYGKEPSLSEELLLEQYPGGRTLMQASKGGRTLVQAPKSYTFISYPFISYTFMRDTFPTYLTWLERVYSNLTKKGNLEEVLFYLDKVMEVYSELKERHPKVYLLHGDLHQENMLLNGEGGYTIIDPKGVVDAPVMETARFLRNETLSREGIILGEEEKIREMVAIISPMIKVSEEDLLKGLFIDTALSCSWTLEEHFSTEEAFKEEKQKALKACEFAYGLLP